MANSSSKVLLTWLGRFLKVVMVVVLMPLAGGLLIGFLDQLNVITASGVDVREWLGWGFVVYLGVHILLYRPVPIFQISHRVFAALAGWLFGGQVASVEGQGGKGKGKGAKADPASQGSTLVAFSPYVIPSYTVLVCAVAWGLTRWLDRAWLDAPVSLLIGVTMAFHWLMTADELQQQREKWHVETYLLAIGLIFMLTVIIGGASASWALPEVSFVQALTDGMVRAKAFYATIMHRLF